MKAEGKGVREERRGGGGSDLISSRTTVMSEGNFSCARGDLGWSEYDTQLHQTSLYQTPGEGEAGRAAGERHARQYHDELTN